MVVSPHYMVRAHQPRISREPKMLLAEVPKEVPIRSAPGAKPITPLLWLSKDSSSTMATRASQLLSKQEPSNLFLSQASIEKSLLREVVEREDSGMQLLFNGSTVLFFDLKVLASVVASQ